MEGPRTEDVFTVSIELEKKEVSEGFYSNVSTYLCKEGAAVTLIKLLGNGEKGTAPRLTLPQPEVPDCVLCHLVAEHDWRWPD